MALADYHLCDLCGVGENDMSNEKLVHDALRSHFATDMAAWAAAQDVMLALRAPSPEVIEAARIIGGVLDLGMQGELVKRARVWLDARPEIEAMACSKDRKTGEPFALTTPPSDEARGQYGAIHTDGSRSGGQPVGTNAVQGDVVRQVVADYVGTTNESGLGRPFMTFDPVFHRKRPDWGLGVIQSGPSETGIYTVFWWGEDRAGRGQHRCLPQNLEHAALAAPSPEPVSLDDEGRALLREAGKLLGELTNAATLNDLQVWTYRAQEMHDRVSKAITTPSPEPVSPAPVTAGKLTPEYLAMTPAEKWGCLTVHGLLGTNEPWIADMAETLAALQGQGHAWRGMEPVAVRYGFDGYGYRYIDSGSGSDWQTRHPDGELLYTPTTEADNGEG